MGEIPLFSARLIELCFWAEEILEARVGFEPTNGGFADLSLRPLGYRAETTKYSESGGDLSVAVVAPASCRRFFEFWGNRQAAGGTPALHDLARRYGHDLCFADEARRFLGRCGTDVESRAPLESCHFSKFGDDLDMPVIMLAGFLSDR